MSVSIETVHAVTEATWPAATTQRAGPWTIRDGRGGGKRVSAATAVAPVRPADLPRAEAAMRAIGQTPLVMIREGEDALDSMLAGRGYRVIDPVQAWCGPVAPLAQLPVPRGRVFAIWEPLAIQIDLWAAAGIGPGRIAVMRRAPPPRTAILGRVAQTAAATAFVAIHARVAMVHALEVVTPCRRQGVATLVMRQAARWAAHHDADHIAALCTRDNAAANALCASLGMGRVGQYHYRTPQDDSSA